MEEKLAQLRLENKRLQQILKEQKAQEEEDNVDIIQAPQKMVEELQNYIINRTQTQINQRKEARKIFKLFNTGRLTRQDESSKGLTPGGPRQKLTISESNFDSSLYHSAV